MMETLDLTLMVLVVSPFVGSFLGVLIERLPAGEAVVLGRSRCSNCGHLLAPVDLVPVLSWMLLRGRCRHCSVRLGWLHPALELAAVLVAVWSMISLPAWLVLPTALLGWTLLALAVIDWRHMILPDVLTVQLIAAGLLVSAIACRGVPVDQLIGAAAGGGLFAAITALYGRVRKREGLGLGDAKLFAGAGAWVGWQGLPSVLLLGAATALAVTIVLAAAGPTRQAIEPRTAVPFGPYLALGIWLTWLYGALQVG